MKTPTRMALGYAILVALLAGQFLFQVVTLRRMQTATLGISGIEFRAAAGALQLMRDRDALEELMRRYFAGPAPEIQAQLKAEQETFESGLAVLQQNAGSENEQREAVRLAKFWKEFLESFARQRPPAQSQASTQLSAGSPLSAELEEQLERLRTQAVSLYEASLHSLSSHAQASRKAGERAELVFWIYAAISLAAGLLVSVFVVRSVSAPLRQLAEGTRAIAEGKDFYRLDTSRNDEFSQIARDFNTLTRRMQPGNPNPDGS